MTALPRPVELFGGTTGKTGRRKTALRFKSENTNMKRAYFSFSWNIWIASFGLALPRLSFMSWPTRY